MAYAKWNGRRAHTLELGARVHRGVEHKKYVFIVFARSAVGLGTRADGLLVCGGGGGGHVSG